MKQSTKREIAASGNGDMQEWIEYEADSNRKPDWMGIGDPNPKYDLAKMLDPDYKTHLAIEELERYLNDQFES